MPQIIKIILENCQEAKHKYQTHTKQQSKIRMFLQWKLLTKQYSNPQENKRII